MDRGAETNHWRNDMTSPKVGFLKGDFENTELGVKLKEAREYIGMKQDEVARHLEIPRTAVSEIENGKRSVSAIELKKLARIYQRDVGWFTGDESEVSSDVAYIARTAEELSNNDRQELQRFAEFLSAKSKA
jgi:transcriptional regulator with XRE-family HTH domain